MRFRRQVPWARSSRPKARAKSAPEEVKHETSGSPKRGRSARRLLRDVLIVGTTFGVGYLIASAWLSPVPFFTKDHAVPRVLELPAAEAQRKLKDLEFRAKFEAEKPHATIPRGSVIWQDPPPGMILPQNKFPFIPPQVDPDPGPPVVQLPPGVAPGPGPAPHGPYPLPVPPNEPGPLPSPFPFYAPPDQAVPPYGRPPPPPAGEPLPLPGQSPADSPPADAPPLPAEAPPQASGQSFASYDKSGTFVDPAGGTGVFAGGADKLAPAENWVDLMMAPRQA